MPFGAWGGEEHRAERCLARREDACLPGKRKAKAGIPAANAEQKEKNKTHVIRIFATLLVVLGVAPRRVARVPDVCSGRKHPYIYPW